MRASPWKHRLTVLLPLAFVGALATEALAQAEAPPCGPRGRQARYTVRVDSVPSGAAVHLDALNCVLGTTPWEGKVRRGDFKFTVKKEGYESAQRTFNVRRTRRVQQAPVVTLVKLPDPPKVEVTAAADQNAFNAEVVVDGQPQGQIPVVLTVSEGRHLVEIRKEGYKPFSQWIDVKEGERFTVNPVLEQLVVEKKGAILVEADVAGAEVYVDGTRHADLTPTLISGLTEGPHVIEVRKEPALPWKQTVIVAADQTVKVSAQLAATMKPPGGTVRVLSNVPTARVYVDGTDMGPAPADIKDVSPGDHLIEVKADGYLPREERVVVNAGTAAVLKLDLQAVPEAETRETAVLKVVSPVPEATIFVDGERIGNAPQEKELQPGEHFVVVTKPGYKKFEQKVSLDVGQVMTVTAELAAVGGLRVLSTPSGAEVYVDGVIAGETPLNQEDVDVGQHVVTVRVPGYYDYEQAINIEGGQRTIVSAKLEMIDTGPTPEELEQEQRSLSSFGARALPQGRSTIDFAAGYPHYMQGQFTVGAGKLAGFGFDAGVVARTFFSRTEVGVKGRLTLVDRAPFSFGVFALVGGGSNFIDDSGRNTLFLSGGALASLTAFGTMTVTGRAYLDIWSDRHCPTETTGDVIDVCNASSYNNNKQRVDDLIGSNNFADLLERENGLRLMTSLVVEVALWQRWSVWALFEGAPFQSERAVYTRLFSPALIPRDDISTYLRLGGTFKF